MKEIYLENTAKQSFYATNLTEKILQNWMTVTFNLNALNRSMGLEDAYPFTLTDAVLDKLRFIHQQVLEKAFYRNDSQHLTEPHNIVRHV